METLLNALQNADRICKQAIQSGELAGHGIMEVM